MTVSNHWPNWLESQLKTQLRRIRQQADLSSVSCYGIFAQTLGVVLGVALVPLLGLMVVNHQNGQLQLAAVEAEFEKAAITTELQVEQWLDTNLQALRQNASLADVLSMETERQNRVMQTLVQTYDWMDIAFVVGAHGYQTARSDATTKPVRKWDGEFAHFRGDRQYFQQVMDGTEASRELLISPTTQLPALCLSVPILSVPIQNQPGKLGDRLGAMVSCSELGAIAAAAVNHELGETGFAILVDAENRVIAQGKRLRTAEQLEDFSDYPALQVNRPEELLQFSWRGRPVVAYVKPVGLEGWRLIVQQETVEAYQSIRRGYGLTFFLITSTGLVTLGVAYRFSRKLVHPLESLTAAADAVSRGKLNVPIVGSDRRDEIGALARSIKRLANSLTITFDELVPGKAKIQAQASANDPKKKSPRRLLPRPKEPC